MCFPASLHATEFQLSSNQLHGLRYHSDDCLVPALQEPSHWLREQLDWPSDIKAFEVCFFFHGRREEHEWVWKSYIKQWKAERKVKGQRELAMSRATGTKVHRWCDDRVEVERVEDECHGVSQALAALQFVPLLPVSGRRDTDVHYVVARRLIVCRSVRYLLLWHNAVDFCRGKLKEDKTQWGSWFVLTLYKWFDIYVYVAVKLPYDIMLKIKDVWLGPYQPQASKLHL